MYPDFALLNVRKQKTIYWEHFGLLSNEEYSKHIFEKLIIYEKSGIEPGTDLIFTMESDKIPLDVKTIEKKITGYLL